MPADQLTTFPAPATSTHNGDDDPGWRQANIEFTDWSDAPGIVAHHLRPALDTAAASWWYIRKHPHWRVRWQATTPDDEPGTAPTTVLDGLINQGQLRTWSPAIYEPEVLAFGGPAGMTLAHALFCRDSLTTLDLLTRRATADPGAGTVELSVLAISRMLRAAGLDWYEQGDVWARVADTRPGHNAARTTAPRAAAAIRRLLTLDTGADTTLVAHGPLAAYRRWLKAFDDSGTQLAALARAGHLARGLRAVLAHHVIFHWNRLALPGHDQHTLAALARDALLPTGIQDRP
jgi:protein-L-isoaspartate(D-aspartate) O-methyltransferase